MDATEHSGGPAALQGSFATHAREEFKLGLGNGNLLYACAPRRVRPGQLSSRLRGRITESRKPERWRFFKCLIYCQDRFVPRRELLAAPQRKGLLAFPEDEENLLQYYTLSVRDLAIYANIAANTIDSALGSTLVIANHPLWFNRSTATLSCALGAVEADRCRRRE